MEKFYERNFYVYENNESEARDFLEEVVKNFIKENFKINEVWNDYPFLTNEKQSFSALAPAIHKLTGVIWLEQPFVGQTIWSLCFEDVETLLKKLSAKISVGEILKIKAKAQSLEVVETMENADSCGITLL